MTRKIHRTFPYVCNQRVRKIGKFFKNKKENRLNINRLSFVTRFKIQFLLPFTGYRKVLRKMPGDGYGNSFGGGTCYGARSGRS